MGRGLAYVKTGLHDLAIDNFTQVLTLDPKDFRACYNKALACEAAGRMREAADAYRQFIAITPSRYSKQTENAKARLAALSNSQ